MGKAIEQIAATQPVEIVWRIRRENLDQRTPDFLRTADVVIEFSRPEAAFDNVMACLDAGVPVVSGTTGWTDRLRDAEESCRSLNGAMIWASNFSIGVNLFFALNRYLARLMTPHPEYRAELTEIHHIHKLDAPSGTAVSLARDIISQSEQYDGYQLVDSHNTGKAPTRALPIHAVREGEVPGTHQICWNSPIDDIRIEHRAHSRAGFAWGALSAAMWLTGKKGVYTMSDVLGIHQ